ncbi:hypothetical protein H9Q13_08520 [Pontibacter sp. JH31]|uniref:DUF4468 domain-containing protein n=1 Tax=Pontibacter aquaedesilientis TaxID=2766980 RepID=A0ABR7XFY6_9BACT|nr:hypothetical protein [Pontibacter aquaedesilientis]MBD1397205.1 hypothetical protein [Pontibacter aquaedesilientis]
MMNKVILVLVVIACSSFVQTDSKLWLAGEELIKTLKAAAPKVEGEAIREYLYQDLNFDNKYEVIEKVNKIEEDAPGFLNVELYPAFELQRVFTYSGGKFHRDYSKFTNYLDSRVEFYRFWKKQIQNPVNLSTDSKELIKANKAMFIKELDRLIELTEKLKK